MQIEKLLEEQKQFDDNFSYLANALDFYTKSHYPTIKKSGTEHLKDIFDWHKQSLKQFVDGLVEWEEEEVRHPLETIEHLKEIRKQLE